MINQNINNILEVLEVEGEWANNDWWITRINGIKLELKSGRKGFGIFVAYGDDEIGAIIRDAFEGYTWTGKGAGCWVETEAEITELAVLIRDYIIDQGLEKVSARAVRKTADQGYFEKTAQLIEFAVKLQHWDVLDRGSLGFDAHDELITVGESKAALANPDAPKWREHIVPCTMVKEEAIRMVEDGATVPQIAQMLKENLAIVVLTAQEAKRLDSVYKTTMPKGWNFGDSVFARLDATGIAY